jgi:hypothetical protein
MNGGAREARTVGDGLPPASERVRIVVEIEPQRRDEFNRMLNDFLFGDVYRKQVEAKAVESAGRIESLKRLVTLVRTRPSGATQVIASVLASLYNGYRFKVDLTDLRVLDRDTFEHVVDVLRLDREGGQEVHAYFEQGGRIWEEEIIAGHGLRDHLKA